MNKVPTFQDYIKIIILLAYHATLILNFLFYLTLEISNPIFYILIFFNLSFNIFV